jgi:hypothetical protein
MFIVVVTLGLLAAMGVYGLSATSADLKSAGHMREALQSQKAGDDALAATAESFNPASAKSLVESMSGAKRTTNCRTAAGAGDVPASIAPYVGTVPVPPKVACLRLSEAEMRIAVNQGITPKAWDDPIPLFQPDGFGAVTSKPNVQVEISNPVDIPPPAGSGYDPATQRFTQVTVTVFVDVRSTINPTAPAQSVVSGRGRITVGPITGAAAAY